jgi:outer membrane protein OmpA-like peptidoglycan-associated protein
MTAADPGCHHLKERAMTITQDCKPSVAAQPKSRPSIRAWGAAAAVIVASVAGCTNSGEVGTPVAHRPDAPATSRPASPSDGAPRGSGITAKPASTAFPMEARDVRLVRLGQQDIALQFELFNGTQEPVAPYDVGLGLIERNFKLVDLPRATAYDVQQANGLDGRVSANQYDEIAPGSAATITAVFTAPSQETTKVWFMTNVLLPVEVPIEPAGAASLKDDPVLTGPRGAEPYVHTLVCASTGPEGDGTETPVEIKLPSDVLFEFAKSDLTPAAQSALDEVDNQIEASTGTITIEGHTDAIGDDASNQRLSEARAASVQAALQDKLGSGFTFNAIGFGESRPVAPNAKPDGSDDPDGRAQNRRVEIRTGGVTATAPPELEARPATNDLAAKGAQAKVDSVKRIGGHLITTVTFTNPTSTAIEVGLGTGLTEEDHRPIGITLADRTTQRRAEVCSSGSEQLEGFRLLNGPPSDYYAPTTSNSLAPGASVQLRGFYAAPPADVTTVEVEIGGLGKVEQAAITS